MSLVKSQDWHDSFTDRLIRELQAAEPLLLSTVNTIFIGGGTPTLLHQDCWVRLLETINQIAQPASDLEFTVEANPETD